jgi:hypothetical protein
MDSTCDRFPELRELPEKSLRSTHFVNPEQDAFAKALVVSFRLEHHLTEIIPVRDLVERVAGLQKAQLFIHAIAPHLESQKKAIEAPAPPTFKDALADPSITAAHEELKLDVQRRKVLFENFHALCSRADDELQRATLASSAVCLARSPRFRVASQAERAGLVAATLPELPAMYLVHWEELMTLRRLPSFEEQDRLKLLSEAYRCHGENVVTTVVIHGWQGRINPDPDNTTARQLIAFAQWYRRTWGEDLEPYFWVDYCCLPPPLQSEQDRMGLSGGLRSPKPIAIEPKGAMFEGALDALLPLVYAASDAVVLCEAASVDTQALTRASLGLAHAFAPGGRAVYALDKSIVSSVLDDDLDEAIFRNSFEMPKALGKQPHVKSGVLVSPRFAQTVFADSISSTSASAQVHAIVSIPRSRHLEHPLHEDVCMRDPKKECFRMAYLVRMCQSSLASVLSGDFHRPPLVFGSSCLHTHYLEMEGKSSSVEEQGGEEHRPRPPLPIYNAGEAALESDGDYSNPASPAGPVSLFQTGLAARNERGEKVPLYEDRIRGNYLNAEAEDPPLKSQFDILQDMLNNRGAPRGGEPCGETGEEGACDPGPLAFSSGFHCC